MCVCVCVLVRVCVCALKYFSSVIIYILYYVDTCDT